MDLCTLEISNALSQFKIFKGAFPCNLIPLEKISPPFGLVINTDRDDQPGSHWVAIYVTRSGHGEYFDSFAFPPTVKEISDFLAKQDTCFCCSRVVIQHPASVACGHFAVGFLYARFSGVTFEDYISTFETDDLWKNDNVILKWNSSVGKHNFAKSVPSLTAKASPMGAPMKNHRMCRWNFP